MLIFVRFLLEGWKHVLEDVCHFSATFLKSEKLLGEGSEHNEVPFFWFASNMMTVAAMFS